MNTGKRTASAAVLAAFCVLTACGGPSSEVGADGARIAEQWQEAGDFTATVRLLADDAGYLYEYAGTYSYDADGADTLTLTAPEELSGLKMDIAGEGETLTVQYADATFDTGIPAQPGATPADGVPALLAVLRQQAPQEVWEEEVGGVRMVGARYESQDDERVLTRQVWLTRDRLRPACAEIYVDGERRLQIFFSDWMDADV